MASGVQHRLHRRHARADTVTPLTLDLALAVQHEITSRLDEADRLRHRQVERAQYEANAARERYMHVDPANRLVADTLEADWNLKLRAVAAAEEERLLEEGWLTVQEVSAKLGIDRGIINRRRLKGRSRRNSAMTTGSGYTGCPKHPSFGGLLGLAMERLEPLARGTPLSFQRPWRDGTTPIVCEPLEVFGKTLRRP